MTADPGTRTTDVQAEERARIPRKRLTVTAVVVGAVLLAVIAWAVTPGWHQTAGPNGRRGDMSRAIPVRAVPATKGAVDVSVNALGTVAALTTVTVRTRVDGPLIQVPFHEGQLVRAGDLLATSSASARSRRSITR